jgi:hypothetical protein
MRKLLIVIPLFILVWGMQAFSADWPFPLDKGRIWGFDDGNIDQIMFCINIEATDTVTKTVFQAFEFEPYNFARRIFYRDGDKVYEWKDGSRRLWYDFNADEKASWKMEWEPVLVPVTGTGGSSGDSSGGMPPASDPNGNITDINDGAIMTLVEKDVKMVVPWGEEFTGCFHFQITRPGVNDAAYVDEWFAPGIGCIQRVWDTVGGPHTQKIAKLYVPEPVSLLRMDVSLDKEVYSAGEDINITVSVLNSSDNPETFNFSSSLQVNYIIDNVYDYSKNHAFTTALSQVIIPPHGTQKWTFTHSSSDYSVLPGKHYISANLVGYTISANAGFYVMNKQLNLPDGVTLSVKPSKESYAQGEAIPFTLTVRNTTVAEVSLPFFKAKPVRYYFNDTTSIPGLSLMDIMPPVEELKIAAGESFSFDELITSDFYSLAPGTYTLYAGLWGYDNMASATFTITNELSLGRVSGTIYGYNIDSSGSPVADLPLQDADIKLSTYIPSKYDTVSSSYPVSETREFTAKSNENGEFTIADVPVGAFYIVTVTKDGYYPYNETIRTLSNETKLNPILKPVQTIPRQDLNYKRHELMGLSIYLGTEQTVYMLNSPANATFKITNINNLSVTFTECYVDWYLELQNGDSIKLSPTPLPADGTKKIAEGISSVETFTLNQNESKSYEYTFNFQGQAPDYSGKYSVRASLRFKGCSIPTLQSGDIADYITILAVPEVEQRIDVNGYSNQIVVDAKSSQQAGINIATGKSEVSGQVLITEIMENFHGSLENKRFIKMVEVDADPAIRDNMQNAVIRIYFKPEELSSSSAMNKLVIAHWDDKALEPKWEILESRVDTANNFVEATTTSFSSFGLFENDVPTGTEGTSVPKVFTLEQNVPNPFNPFTTIQFLLPETGIVKLSVYNLVGQEVARLVDGKMTAGVHRVVFNGNHLGSGIYFYRVTGKGINATRKMLLVK